MTVSRDVFLCHATADKDALARPLYKALRTENLSVWFDEAEIPWGAPIAVAMQRGLSTSRYILVLVTPEFVAPGGHWRHEELDAALAAQVESGMTRILPLVAGLDHATLMAKIPFLAARRYERLDADQGTAEAARRVRQLLTEAAQLRILSRTQVDAALGAVEERFASAREEVCISGNDCKFVAESLSPVVEKALERGLRVRFLCVDPESPAAEMLPMIDPRFPTADTFRESVRGVEAVLRRMGRSFPTLELRYLPILPAIGFFLVDPKLPSGSAKIELYLAKPFQPIESRPHLIIGAAMHEWRLYFAQQWENYWALGHVPATDP
jgi:TIR domain